MTDRYAITGQARWLLLLGLLLACDRDPKPTLSMPSASAQALPPSRNPSVAPARRAPNAEPEPVHVETVSVQGDAPAFVLRGARGPHRMVFLHGYCSHALGYVQSFQHAAATAGTLVAVQADKRCDQGPFRRWTNTPERLNERIETAFRAAGDDTSLEGLAVLGYSSGAVLAEMLAHKFPRRYAYVILIGGPQKPVEWRLRKTRSTVMIAGSKDRQDLMKKGARDLTASGIPSTFMVLPNAKHGQMGPESERVMGVALEWLWQNQRPL